jgi:hypothetical protein
VNAVIESAASPSGIPRLSGPNEVKSITHVLGSSRSKGGALSAAEGVAVGVAGTALGIAVEDGVLDVADSSPGVLHPARSAMVTPAAATKRTIFDDKTKLDIRSPSVA